MAEESVYPVRLRMALEHASTIFRNLADYRTRSLDDDDIRLLRRAMFELDAAALDANLVLRMPPAPAGVTRWTPEPGMAHCLADLQDEAFEKYSMARSETLAAAVELYVRGVITYPLVATQNLPMAMYPAISQYVREQCAETGRSDLDPDYVSPAWVDTLTQAHSALMLNPLALGIAPATNFTSAQLCVHELIRQRTLNLFRRPD